MNGQPAQASGKVTSHHHFDAITQKEQHNSIHTSLHHDDDPFDVPNKRASATRRALCRIQRLFHNRK